MIEKNKQITIKEVIQILKNNKASKQDIKFLYKQGFGAEAINLEDNNDLLDHLIYLFEKHL